jgi:hypothetical protein
MRSAEMVDYHWSPANQRAFLEQLAIVGNVTEAAKSVSMSAQGAYAFAARSAGRVFALGWDAAVLIARRRVEGDLMERALAGQEETYERDPDSGKVKRTRIYNGVTMAMLKRLDAMVAGKADCPADAAMARIVAQDFERFLDIIEGGGSGAEAMLFLKARDGGLVPMAHLPQAIEALEFAKHHQLSQKSEGFDAKASEPEAPLSPEEAAATMSVWYCGDAEDWRTNFPPSEDFIGEEEGEFGEDGYERELDDEEQEHCRAQLEAEIAPLRMAGEAARRAFFCIVEKKAMAACEREVGEVVEGTDQGLSPQGDCPQMVPRSVPLGSEAPEGTVLVDARSVPLGTVPNGTVPGVEPDVERDFEPQLEPCIEPPKTEVITHRPVYMKPSSRYIAAGQIPPWAERIA